ncbi:hypothetical protein [Pseudonocardia acidicola]|uniref:hypothetical protein n=1 Tax=Pseudonocardia acidicola TaxID=2724939 RepID=UPI001B7D06EC|nr:hypothetical protein [Pseudonocardia acidicola]
MIAMRQHTLVLKLGLVIHSVYSGYRFRGRPSVDDLWRGLRAATSEIRPDWDLSTPGLREAWAAGDRSLFHGGDRRSGARFPRREGATRDGRGEAQMSCWPPSMS